MERAALDLSNPGEARAAERLRRDIIVWLGTVRPDGRPHLVPVWFLWDGSVIYVFSKPDQKVRNLRENRNVVLALDDTKGGGNVILIDGQAELLPHGEVTTELPAYAEKYADRLQAYNWTPSSMAQEYSQAIRITPTRFRVW